MRRQLLAVSAGSARQQAAAVHPNMHANVQAGGCGIGTPSPQHGTAHTDR